MTAAVTAHDDAGTGGEPVEIYTWWDKVPEHLKTATQLGKLGLKPGPAPAARICYTAYKRERSYDLFDVAEAIPKREMTDAQRAALEKAQIALRTCRTCKMVVEKPSYLSKRKRCGDCRAASRRRKRAIERDSTIQWARGVLGSDALILDTETIDLHSYICEIAIIDVRGNVLFDALINPLEPNGATHIHGISDEMTKDAPTFADVLPDLRRLLEGRMVVVYNADYDRGVLRMELERWYTGRHPKPTLPDDLPPPWEDRDVYNLAYAAFRTELAAWEQERNQALAWFHTITWDCAMLEYACYVGDWHDYYGNYRYQPLGGGHRALGDCRACLQVVREMASTSLGARARIYDRKEEAHGT